MGRWTRRLLVLLLITGMVLAILLFYGRLLPERLIEVDVTDQLRDRVPEQ